MRGLWAKAVERGRAADPSAADRVSLLSTVDEIGPGPDVVVEAVPERFELKRDVLRAAEASGPRLLASNTCSIPIGSLAAALARPERFIGLHFFNPVSAVALPEIVVRP